MWYTGQMVVTAELIPNTWIWVGSFLYALLLAGAIRGAPWRLLQDNQRMHVYLGACVGLMVIWSIKAGVSPGLTFHYLGATLLTLMFGWQLAIIALSLVLFGTNVSLGGEWQGFALTMLCKGALPVLLSHGLLRLVQRKLPANVFIYIFLNAFLTAALAIFVSTVAIAALFEAAGTYTSQYLLSDYLAFTPLMMFSEAWITGMLIAIFVGYRPSWLATFEDRRYLHGK